MKYIKYTYVDSVTQVSVVSAPATNGPTPPQVKGLTFLFALERKYPTPIPEFIGQCDDDADLAVDGVFGELTEDEVSRENEQEDATRAQYIRESRNYSLAASDWTQGKDIPDSISLPWAEYRQALRDMTDQDGFPRAVIWPVAPEL